MCLNISQWYGCVSLFLMTVIPLNSDANANNTDISVKYVDNFTDFDGIWTGDTGLFQVDHAVQPAILKQTEGSSSGTSQVCRESDVAFGSWEFSVSFEGFQTSNQNYALVWIQRASLNSLHGIFVRIGENGSSKRIRLLASDPTGATTELLASGQPLPADLATVHLRLTRTPTSRWTLQYRFNTSGPWHSDQADHPADLHAQSLFCLATRYTPTRADKFSFGPITTSTHTTFLAHYTTPAPDQLHLHFSKLLPPNTGSTVSVQIDGYTGSVTASVHLNTLRLRLSPAPGGGSRRLVLSNLHDYETSLIPITMTAQIQWFDAARPLDIVINEFIPRPPSPNEAFIELLNTSDRYIHINGWTIGRSSTFHTISHTHTVAPGDFLVVQRHRPTIEKSESTHYIEAPIFPLGLTTDKLYLKNSDGVLIDSIHYTPSVSSTWIPGRSIEKRSPSYSGMDERNWAQHPLQDSRGYTNNTDPLLWNPESPTMHLHITPDTISILFDRFMKWSPESALQLNSYQVTLPDWNPFTSSKIQIQTPGSITLHTSPLPLRFHDVMSFDSQQVFTLEQEAAQPPRPGDLFLNEILYQPLQDRYASFSDQSEFIEIHNTAPWKISLQDVIIRDPIDKNGRFSFISPLNADLWAVDAKHFALIVPDTSASLINSRIAQFFSITPDASWGHVLRSGLSLTTSGKSVVLSLLDGTVLDSVHYSPTMHHPLLREQKGISLERTGGYNVSSNVKWTSSASPLGATPGQLNSVSVSLSESESNSGFQFHPNPFSPNHDGIDDIVEIKLHSSTIDIFSRITIYDLRGRRIKTVLNDGLTGRITSAIWDGTDDRGIMSPTGVYIVLAESYDPESKSITKHKKPLVLVRPR